MEAGIVGLPNVGKSTLFNALTMSKAAQSANYPFCTIEPNEGMVSVPDERLGRIAALIPPQKLIPAALKLVDIAGIVKGASEGQGLGNKFLAHIREVDAILQVVRCFEDPDVIHVAGKVDPVEDMETIELELILADLQHLENLLPKAERAAKSTDKEARLKVEVMRKCLAHLGEQKPLRTLVLARRVLTAAEWAEWNVVYDAASTTLEDREAPLRTHCLPCAPSTRPAERARRLGHCVFRSMLPLPCARVQGDD